MVWIADVRLHLFAFMAGVMGGNTADRVPCFEVRAFDLRTGRTLPSDAYRTHAHSVSRDAEQSPHTASTRANSARLPSLRGSSRHLRRRASIRPAQIPSTLLLGFF
jgi:hypothetical protein